MHRPLFRVPNEAAAFHLSVLRTGSPDPAVVSAMLAQNRAFYDEAVAVGGNRYIIGAIPDFSPRDWRRHFDGSWGFLVQSKRRFDPENVLTPGQGIFVDH
jgi:cytokinin dehydrogenase